MLNYETSDQQHSIDNMSDTLMIALQRNADNGNFQEMKAIYEEWVVDSVDPQDGGYEFTFVPDLTDIIEDN